MQSWQWRDNPDYLYKTTEVADIFRVKVRTIYRWRREGKLEAATLPGGGIRYREGVVRKLYENH